MRVQKQHQQLFHQQMALPLLLVIVALQLTRTTGCQFYPVGEYLKFVRVPENLKIGSEILPLEVHPRNHLTIMPDEDAKFFAIRETNRTHVSIVLAESLDELVDAENPRNLLKFRIVCDYSDGVDSLVSSHLSVTVYVEDINDHAPQFIHAPYHLAVDELTPAGRTIFRGIHAFDSDKPNTPNSDIHYAIVKGNEQGKFALESGHRTALILRKPLDYDAGDREFLLVITASDRGTPTRSTNTTVRILIRDNDDLNPKFTQEIYRAKVYEFYPIPTNPIHTEINFSPPIHASDRDKSINAPLKYDIISGNERGVFQINPNNGSIFIEKPIDLESEKALPGNTFILQIHASQTDNPLKMDIARVEIEVLDLNDNLPIFEVDFYNISIVENLPNGFSVLQVIAEDKDQGENGEFTYQLDDPSDAFSIEPKSGWLTVKNQNVLDREKTSVLKMRVYALERKPSVVPNASRSFVNIEVTLLDANDNNPIFLPGNVYEFVTQSNVEIDTVLGQVHAMDEDLGKNGKVVYQIQKPGNSSRSPFKVNPNNGVISVAQSPIIEGRHAIFVEAADQPTNPSERRFSLAVVTIDVLPADDNNAREPDFVGAPYEFWVGANVPVGTSVGQIRVNEAVKNEDLIYDLLHSYHEGVPFAVEERSGTITVVSEIENYDRSSYDFEAVVTNEKELTLVTNVSVHVVDPNDERGILTKGATKALVFHAKENIPVAFVGQVLNSTSPHDTRYVIANQQDVPEIAITEDGTLYAPNGLDREVRQNYSVTVIAENPRGVGVFQVTIIVDDANDNAPMFSSPSYEGHIPENSAPGTEVSLLKPIEAKDPDEGENSVFNYTLRGEGSQGFRIDQKGKVFWTGSVLDREEKAIYDLRIMATDKGGLQSEATLTIRIGDKNDNAPGFLQMIVLPDQGVRVATTASTTKIDDQRSPLLLVPENVTIGTPIIRLIAQDKDEHENAKITFVLDNNTDYNSSRHFLLDSKSGEISILRALPAERDINLTVVARDIGNLTDTVVIRIHVTDVNDNPPIFKKSFYNFDIPEGMYKNYVLGSVKAVDYDHADNANISYKILSGDPMFSIATHTGILTVSGTLDREVSDSHQLKILARDGGQPSLSSTVDVEIIVLDLNDNAPSFFGFEEYGKMKKDDKSEVVPVFKASVLENSPIGTIVTRVYANDSDFSGNGNGLILYDLPHAKGEVQYFNIDSKEGFVTTTSNLDYETQSSYNLTVLASDLGSPSLTSTALLSISVLDVIESDNSDGTFFDNQYYEVEVDENSPVPLFLLQLDVTKEQRSEQLRFSIIPEGDAREFFSVDSRNGSLYAVKNLDRETKPRHTIKVRADKVKISRGMPVMVYPVVGERLNGLARNEAKIVVKVKDVNDNSPRFRNNAKPLLAAIPSNAYYGYEVIKVEAKDPDEGANGEIRYQILGKDDAPRFAIDPLSGQVRSVGSFSRDAGRVFGFDVKATDNRGAENGRSSIANVFVYVLDDHKQLVMVMGKKPIEIESQVENITRTLHNITGLDIRVRKLEPHIEKNLIDTTSTDMYLYAVDPHLNVMVNMDTLQSLFLNKKMEIKRELEEFHVLDIAGMSPRRSSPRYLLSTLEVGVIVLGCVVFVGALVTALCVTCVRRNKRRRRHEKMFSSNGPVGFALSDPTATLQKPPLFPNFVDGLHHYDPDSFTTEMRQHSLCEHEPNCVRFHAGHDSGIVSRAACHCSHSSSPSSGESSKSVFYRMSNNGYEDSLKSLQRQSHETLKHGNTTQGSRRPRQRFHSFSNLESIYSQETTLPHEKRCCTEKRRHNNNNSNLHHSGSNNNHSNNNLNREHRRVHSEAENNITETVIHEHPRTELSGTFSNVNLHGKHDICNDKIVSYF